MGKEKKDAHQLSPKVCILTCLRCKDTSSDHVDVVNAVGMKTDSICGRRGKTAQSWVVLYLSLSRAELTHILASEVTHPCVVLPSLSFVVFLSGPPRAAVEKPKGPSRRSSRAEKEVEEEPVMDSGIRKRSARPGTSAAVKGNFKHPSSFQTKKEYLSLHLSNKIHLALLPVP